MALNGPWLRPASDSTAQAVEWVTLRERLAAVSTSPGVRSYGFDALACAANRPARCVHAVLRPAASFRESADSGAFVSATPFIPEAGPFHEAAGSWLADLLAAMGPGRFRQFWQSPLGVEEGFRAAFGEPLGEWTVGWARTRIGTPTLGPSPGIVDGVSVLVWLALAGVAASWARARREAV